MLRTVTHHITEFLVEFRMVFPQYLYVGCQLIVDLPTYTRHCLIAKVVIDVVPTLNEFSLSVGQ